MSIQTLLTELEDLLKQRILLKGGQGSGGWGHDGRLGKHGGSKAGSAGLSKISANKRVPPRVRKLLAKRVSDTKKPGIRARKVREKLVMVEEKTKARYGKKEKRLNAEKEVLGEKINKLLEKQMAIDSQVSHGKLSFEEGEKRQDKLIERTKKHFARRAAINDEIYGAKIRSSTLQKQRELLYAKEGPAELNIKFKTKFSKKRKERTQEGIDEFAKMIGKGTVLDDMSIEIRGGGKQRSFCESDLKIALSTSAGQKIVVHELGHALDFGTWHNSKGDRDNVNKHALAFLEKRTAGETAKKLKDLTDNSGYANDEIAKPDKFSDPYTGKIYKGVTSEIISTGFEQMWSNPAKFAKDDPDFFDFIFTTLEGARTYQ